MKNFNKRLFKFFCTLFIFIFFVYFIDKKNKIIKTINIILFSFVIFVVINLKIRYNFIVFLIIIYISIDISFQNYKNLIFFFGIFFYTISILLSFQKKFYAKRSGFISFTFLNYLSLNILNKLINKSKIFYIISLYTLISSFKFIIPNILNIYKDTNEINKIIFNSKKKGIYNIVIPKKYINNYNGLLDWAPLTENSKNIINLLYNKYYNISSIKVS